MKRLFQPGSRQDFFIAFLRLAIFSLLFGLAVILAAGIASRTLSSTSGQTSAPSAVTPVPPFVGDHSETWEEFALGHIPNGTPILGGIATITGTKMFVAHHFHMCSVSADASDGTNLMDQDRPFDQVVISFSQPVSAFGAYWGSGVGCPFPDAATGLSFYDVDGNLIGGDSFFYDGTGPLQWHGYTFGTPVWTIIRTASDAQEGFAMDGLQVIVVGGATPTPTPTGTQTPTPSPNPTSVTASGSINGSGDQASFSLNATKSKRNKWKGSFSYSDPAAGLTINGKKLSGFTVTGNQVQFTGSAKLAQKLKVTFTVDATDNGEPGTLDTLSISVSNGYSAGGDLMSGDVMIQ